MNTNNRKINKLGVSNPIYRTTAVAIFFAAIIAAYMRLAMPFALPAFLNLILCVIFPSLFAQIFTVLHELGHLFAARMFRIRAKRFRVGTVFHFKGRKCRPTRDRWGTYWYWNLPIGGEVQFLCEKRPIAEIPSDVKDVAYPCASRLQRVIIAAAGPTASFLTPLPPIFMFVMIFGYESFAISINQLVDLLVNYFRVLSAQSENQEIIHASMKTIFSLPIISIYSAVALASWINGLFNLLPFPEQDGGEIGRILREDKYHGRNEIYLFYALIISIYITVGVLLFYIRNKKM